MIGTINIELNITKIIIEEVAGGPIIMASPMVLQEREVLERVSSLLKKANAIKITYMYTQTILGVISEKYGVTYYEKIEVGGEEKWQATTIDRLEEAMTL